MTRPGWIAADWGSTHLRVWAMDGASVLDRAESEDGMGRLARDGFEPALLALVGGWLAGPTMPVVACGMVGARQGWIEAPYRAVPAFPLGAPVRVPGSDPRLAVHIVPGLEQKRPADVMRGEETQIAGFLTMNPGWDGVLCLPGTHSKWAEVSAGEVISFRTFMTGELFALLAQRSVLRHSIAPEGWDEPAFLDALAESMSRPEQLAARLFSLRAEDLLNQQPASVARARLSGFLIGAELAAARPYWLGRQLAVIGATATARPYAAALAAQGVPATLADPQRMTLAGLTAAWRTLKEPR